MYVMYKNSAYPLNIMINKLWLAIESAMCAKKYYVIVRESW